MILRDHLEGIPVSTCLLHVGWNLPEPLNVDDDDDIGMANKLCMYVCNDTVNGYFTSNKLMKYVYRL